MNIEVTNDKVTGGPNMGYSRKVEVIDHLDFQDGYGEAVIKVTVNDESQTVLLKLRELRSILTLFNQPGSSN